MKTECDVQEMSIPGNRRGSTLAYLAVGLGVGAAVSLLLAPKSGAETRLWIANKCLNGIDTANEKVRKTRSRVKHVMDQGQEKISDAVDSGREAYAKAKAAAE